MKNIKRTIQVRLSDGEEKMLNELCSRFGCGASALVKDWLRWNHKKAFPAYKSGSEFVKRALNPDGELTPEQECEKWGGRIFESNGIKSCRLPTVGASAILLPMSAYKEFKKYHKP